jgi:hypothetical protein
MNANAFAHRPIAARAAAPGETLATDPGEVDIDLERFEHWLDGSGRVSAWPCHVDSVRAQLESVVYRLPPPASGMARASFATPRVIQPVSSNARQIERLTRRAEAAEARVRKLRAQIAAEQASFDALGRRFGRLPHESFAAFVARLGMTAKAMAAIRAKSDPSAAD